VVLLLAIITSCRSGGHNNTRTKDEVKRSKYIQSEEQQTGCDPQRPF